MHGTPTRVPRPEAVVICGQQLLAQVSSEASMWHPHRDECLTSFSAASPRSLRHLAATPSGCAKSDMSAHCVTSHTCVSMEALLPSQGADATAKNASEIKHSVVKLAIHACEQALRVRDQRNASCRPVSLALTNSKLPANRIDHQQRSDCSNVVASQHGSQRRRSSSDRCVRPQERFGSYIWSIGCTCCSCSWCLCSAHA